MSFCKYFNNIHPTMLFVNVWKHLIPNQGCVKFVTTINKVECKLVLQL